MPQSKSRTSVSIKLKCKWFSIVFPFNIINQNYFLILQNTSSIAEIFFLLPHEKLSSPSLWKVSAVHLFIETFLIFNKKPWKWREHKFNNILKYQQMLCFNKKAKNPFWEHPNCCSFTGLGVRSCNVFQSTAAVEVIFLHNNLHISKTVKITYFTVCCKRIITTFLWNIEINFTTNHSSTCFVWW